MKIQKINLKTGEYIEVEMKPTIVHNVFSRMQTPTIGELNKEQTLFVPNQALELGEIISRSARGMEIPIVTRQGVYISKSIDDEIDILDKMDKDLTDYTKALLKYRHQQEQLKKANDEKNKKKEELYNEWLNSLNIKKDEQTSAE
jgi:hypothetical protein